MGIWGAMRRHRLTHTQVLNNKCVHIARCRLGDELGHALALPVGDQGVQGQMDRHPTDVAVFHRLGQGLDGKILGALAGIEAAAAQINGVRTVFPTAARRASMDPAGANSSSISHTSHKWLYLGTL